MKFKVILLVLLISTLKCEGGLSLLGGIFSTAHEHIHSQVQDVAGAILGTLNKGLNLNFETQLGVNQQRQPGYGYGPTQGPQNQFGPDDYSYGQGTNEYRPNQNGYEQPTNNNRRPYPPNHSGYNRPSQNENYNFNQESENENQRYPNNPNYNNNYQGYPNNNNNGYDNHERPNVQNFGNEDKNNYGNQNQGYDNYQNYQNSNGYNQNHHYRPNYGNKPINEIPPNNGYDNKPNYANRPVNGNPSHNGYGHNPNYGNRPVNVNPSNNEYDNNPNYVNRPVNENSPNNDTTAGQEYPNFIDTTSPIPDFTTSTVSSVEISSQKEDDKTTEKSNDNELPLFIPLGPNDYVYGGDKINITAPKRESEKKPQPAKEENFDIDIRFNND